MITAPFAYARAESVDDAIGLLAEHGDDAKLLAGGHSLLPLMKLRLATPSVLVDISDLKDLSYVRDEGNYAAIGGLTRHHDIATSPLLRDAVPILSMAAGQVGDPQVRHRGTLGGSLAHGDPASDLPAVLLALFGTVVALHAGLAAEDAARRADEGTDPPSDLNASPDYRRHLARVLVRRALTTVADA
jgi:carbon-monoxide dehydrogenase medium subunit